MDLDLIIKDNPNIISDILAGKTKAINQLIPKLLQLNPSIDVLEAKIYIFTKLGLSSEVEILTKPKEKRIDKKVEYFPLRHNNHFYVNENKELCLRVTYQVNSSEWLTISEVEKRKDEFPDLWRILNSWLVRT